MFQRVPTHSNAFQRILPFQHQSIWSSFSIPLPHPYLASMRDLSPQSIPRLCPAPTTPTTPSFKTLSRVFGFHTSLAIAVNPKCWGETWYRRPAKMLFRELSELGQAFHPGASENVVRSPQAW